MTRLIRGVLKYILFSQLICAFLAGNELQLLQRADDLIFDEGTRLDCAVDPDGGFWFLFDLIWDGPLPLFWAMRYTGEEPPVSYDVGTGDGFAHGFVNPRFSGISAGQLLISNQHLSDVYPERARLLVIDYRQQSIGYYFTPPLATQYMGRIWPTDSSHAAAYYFDDRSEGRLFFFHQFSLYTDYPDVGLIDGLTDFDGDTIWTLSGVAHPFQDRRLSGTDFYGCVYTYAADSGVGFTCFNGTESLVLDTVVTEEAAARDALQVTDSLFCYIWNPTGGSTLHLWCYAPFLNQVIRDSLFYTPPSNSMELVSRFRMAARGDSLCIQYPVLETAISEQPENWQALVRRLFVAGMPVAKDTVMVFADNLQNIWHTVTMDRQGVHSGVATYTSTGIAKTYYYGPRNVMVGVDPEPSRSAETFSLLQTYPNPFNAAMTIEFTCGLSGGVQLMIYDLSGRTLFQDELASVPGLNRYVWPGRDRFGAAVGSGVYLLVLSAGDQEQVKKITILR